MKSFTLLVTLFWAIGFGAAFPGSECTEFEIDDFYASCIPHSTYCSYEFTVIANPSGETTHCSAYVPGPDYLPTVALMGCEDPSVSWSFDIGSYYTLTVTSEADTGSNLTGTYIIPGDEVVVQNHGAVSDQIYVGPQNFTITNLE